MAFFEWKNEYSGGITEIDEQHKVIIELMNELYDAIRFKKEETITKNVFIELLKYSNYHFNLEGQLFDKYQYEKEDQHINEHKHFIEKIKTLIINEYLTDHNIAIETLQYLKNWFQNHMLKTDMDYCEYFNGKEIMEEIDLFLKSDW
jgi:hemerythrin-like metal-binding protein